MNKKLSIIIALSVLTMSAMAAPTPVFNANQLTTDAPVGIKDGATTTNQNLTTPKLKSENGTVLMNMTGGNLRIYQSSGDPVLDANGSELMDIDGGAAALNWSNRTMQRANGNQTLRWGGASLEVDYLKGMSDTPTVTAGAGSGTTSTVTIAGSATAGKVTIATGTNPATNSVIVTVAFAIGRETPPYVVLWPANDQSANLWFMPFVNETTNGFTINSTLPLASGTTYKFNYVAIE